MSANFNQPRGPIMPDAIDTYWAAFEAHNSGLIEAAAYLAAFHDMHDFVPTNPRDFVRKFVAAYDMGGVPTEDRREQLLEQARGLLAEAVGEEGQSLRAAYLTAQRFEQFARGVSDRYREHIMAPVLQAHKDGFVDGKAAEVAEEGWEPHTSLHFDAIEALITTPAPDLAAVAEKIDLGRAEGAFTNGNRADQMMLCLSDDVRRIAGMPYARAKGAEAAPAAWEGAVAEWQAAFEQYHSWQGPDDVPQQFCDAETAAWRKMLDTPAPDHAALKFKLDRLLKVEACVDSTNAWDAREVRQTLADVARLLGGEQ
ncbi:hypothetical protein [Novosphingobium capsulatum]|uniref:hypothetical protein n=1 Tax=Novosphingobium capsulatum TaxID=13688 RepID=UPI000787FAFF|nr:hypothetical protein [Novosphingobium capsulatum]WQD92742.1 hypothetical protein U0041_17435 [Novosphingobium capsulatum]